MGLGVLVVAAASWKAFGAGPAARKVAPAREAAIEVTTPMASSNGSREVQDRLDLLQAQVAGLRQELAERQAIAVAAPANSAAAPDPASTADQDRVMRERLEQVQANFEAEPRDMKWSRATTTELGSAIAGGPMLQAAVLSVDCRSATCRVEMLDDRSPAFHRQLEALARTVGPDLPSMAGERVMRPDGTAIAVYYWSRGS